jgi:hypothetical protein
MSDERDDLHPLLRAEIDIRRERAARYASRRRGRAAPAEGDADVDEEAFVSVLAFLISDLELMSAEATEAVASWLETVADVDISNLARYFVEAMAESLPETKDGHRQMLEFCVALIREATAYAEIVDGMIANPEGDQTGNPWPGCICNDARYELGHMESCAWHGFPPDAPEFSAP